LTPRDRSRSTQELVRTALLAALCIAIGYLFSRVPNIELISAATFTSGVLVGVRRGAVVGALAESIYAGFNPYGVSPPPLFASQVLGFVLLGAAGGVWGPILRRLPLAAQAAAAGIAGFTMTLVYDLLTNFAVWVMARETSSLAAVLIGGLSFPFPLAHALVNSAGFALLVPAVLRAVQRRTAA
jgi:hypothetical protein